MLIEERLRADEPVEWKPWPRRPEAYSISSDGQVASFLRSIIGRRVLRPRVSAGYWTIIICERQGKAVTRLVHRLVLETFVGPCPEGMEALHRNGDSLDNRLSNLRWGTKEENWQDRAKHQKERGRLDGRVALMGDALEFALSNRGVMKQVDIARALGVSRGTIQRLHEGRGPYRDIELIRKCA